MSEETEVLRQKIHDARNSELMGLGFFVLGFVIILVSFFIGAITDTRWRIGGYVIRHPYALTALVMVIFGGLIVVIGGTLGVYYSHIRSQDKKLLEKMTPFVSCPRCGKKLKSRTKYCPHCGTEIA